GGWFLTDDFSNPYKFRIPDGTMLLTVDFTTYDEDDFNTPANLPTSFQLSSTGDEVWLFSADTQSNLTGHVHGFEFGAAQNGVSFGRHITTIGEEHFPAQSALSLGATNAEPKVGPIVISEIMYHPADLEGTNNVRDEYIELTNISDGSIDLYDSTYTWRIRNAVDYDFPQGTSIPSGSRILVVGFDPLDTVTLAAFRAAYGVSPSVPVFGPWSGTLNNGGEEIELKWPDTPNLDGSVPYLLAEEVGYEAVAPWPSSTHGTNQSLRRVDNTLYGDDPANWQAASPSPGTATPTPDIDPPAPNPASFSLAPSAISDTEISMTATTGSDVRRNHPIEYLFTETSGNPGGTSSAWQTSPSYTDAGLTVSTQYTYTVTLRDSLGNTGTASTPANAIAIGAPTPNPASFAVAPAADSPTAISMTATTGSDPDGPVKYLFTETSGNPGGTSSAWQTSPSYTNTGLTPSLQYTYTVTMRDSLGNTGVASAPASATTPAGPAVFYSQSLDTNPGWTTEGLWS
ncbi:MAG: lamin tail domain-containing protein, partial [Lentisphaeria bacterium]|nr:lamin tail domain-containing protein [Lentisphaeria bacterium]